jgi:hypothetical protein
MRARARRVRDRAGRPHRGGVHVVGGEARGSERRAGLQARAELRTQASPPVRAEHGLLGCGDRDESEG